MANGANFVHKQLRTGLEEYIKSQYFGKSPILLSALSGRLDEEGLLYQKPFIESSPAYVTVQNGMQKAQIDTWMKEYFLELADAGIGVFPSPFTHQIKALEAAVHGKDLFPLGRVLVKQSVLCGLCLRNWQMKREIRKIPGHNEVFERSSCIR